MGRDLSLLLFFFVFVTRTREIYLLLSLSLSLSLSISRSLGDGHGSVHNDIPFEETRLPFNKGVFLFFWRFFFFSISFPISSISVFSPLFLLSSPFLPSGPVSWDIPWLPGYPLTTPCRYTYTYTYTYIYIHQVGEGKRRVRVTSGELD